MVKSAMADLGQNVLWPIGYAYILAKSVMSRNHNGHLVGMDRGTSWLRIRIQILDLNMPRCYLAL